MRKIYLLIIWLAPVLIFCPQLKASHAWGASANYECVNSCSIRVNFYAYEECSGATVFMNPFANSTFQAPPGCNQPTLIGGGYTMVSAVEVTPLAPNIVTKCTDVNSLVLGIREQIWEGLYDACNGNCNTYIFSWGLCCRNAAITSLVNPSGQSSYIEDTISRPALFNCNSSPEWLVPPVIYLCSGANASRSWGASDPDGDSLVFSFSSCMTGQGANANYNAGYTPNTPLGPSWQVNLNSANGTLDFVANPGNYEMAPVCIQLDEYRNGQKIGSMSRDVVVLVMNCPGGNNLAPAITLSNPQGGATLQGDTILLCDPRPFAIDIQATDPNAGDTLRLLWSQNIPGATFTDTNNPGIRDTIFGLAPTGEFNWAPSGPGTYSFLVQASDNYTPINETVQKHITIIVGPTNYQAIITGTDTLRPCQGNTSVTLDAGPGFVAYVWGPGPPLLTQTNVVTTPGTYYVTATDAQGCNTLDSAVVPYLPAKISGTITTSQGASLANQRVYLIRHDTATASLLATDSTTTDPQGFYQFCIFADTFLYVKAAPDSAAYPLEMPTYADTALFFNNAFRLYVLGTPYTLNFSTRAGQNPGGPGFIGGLIAQGANKTNGPGDPMPNVTVWLINNTTQIPVGHTLTDLNGYFNFQSLPMGDYKVAVDVPNVDEFNSPVIPVDGLNTVRDSLKFLLHSTYLEWDQSTAAEETGTVLEKVEISPNPMQSEALIHILSSKTGEIELEWNDITGRKVRDSEKVQINAGENTIRFEKRELKAGIYFLNVKSGTSNTCLKVLILD